MRQFQRVKVKNSLGLHARPATIISRLLHKSKSSVSFTCRGETIDPKSIMNILMLAAGKNAEIDIEVEGEDAEVILEQLVHAFETKFGEEVESQI